MNQQGHRFINVIAYVGILFFLPLVLIPKSRISRFHANQGLVLLLLGVAGNAAIALFPFLKGFVYSIFNLGLFILMIIGMYRAWNFQLKPLPLIGSIHLIRQ
jgi:uncharacterized membrane protein